MHKSLLRKLLLLFFIYTYLNSATLIAQDLPQAPGNFGLTSVLDGAPPMPGIYYMGYVQTYAGNFVDPDGNTIKPNEVNPLRLRTALVVNQFAWISKLKVLGGNFEMMALIPTVHLNTPAPYNLVGKSGLGDIVVGAGIQWFNKKFLGKPFFHRVEIDVSLPTGFYDDEMGTRPINASPKFMVIEPYWSQTLMLSKKTSVSLRHHLTYNRPTDIIPNVDYQVGMMYHVNYALAHVISGPFIPTVKDEYRLAIQGYYANQFTDDTIDGEEQANTRESVFAVGPSLNWITKEGLVFEFKTAYEVLAENRTKGWRSTFRFVYLLKK